MSARVCPKCSEAVCLFDPAEEDWLDASDFEEDAEVWACVVCDWNEEADPDEAFEEHMAQLDWIAGRIGAMQAARSGEDTPTHARQA